MDEVSAIIERVCVDGETRTLLLGKIKKAEEKSKSDIGESRNTPVTTH